MRLAQRMGFSEAQARPITSCEMTRSLLTLVAVLTAAALIAPISAL